MRYFVIPARRNSKGLPFKNRKLFEFTAATIPKNERTNTIVSTDDEEVSRMAADRGFSVHPRTPEVSLDTASTTDLLREVAKFQQMKDEDDIVMLYLTYPERSYEDIERIYRFYKRNGRETVLCKETATTHPYMCYYELSGDRGIRIIDHDLYRRQDYPPCFFVSYFVAIVRVGYLKLVNKNLYHPRTLFYQLDNDSIDVDTQEDLENFLNK
jgi:CMP-N-acetylneuraminic acid synthetase